MLVARSFQRARRVATGPRSALVLPGSSFTGHRLVPIDHTRRRRLSEVVMAAYNLEKFKDFSLLLSQWCTVVNGLQMLKLSLVVAWVMWKQNALTVRQAQAQPKSLKDRFSEAKDVGSFLPDDAFLCLLLCAPMYRPVLRWELGPRQCRVYCLGRVHVAGPRVGIPADLGAGALRSGLACGAEALRSGLERGAGALRSGLEYPNQDGPGYFLRGQEHV